MLFRSRVFGAKVAWLAFRDDAVVLAAGPRAASLVREAVAVAPVTTPRIAEVRVAPDRLAPLSGDLGAQDAARGERDGGTVRLTAEGGGSLKLRLTVPLKLIEWAGALARSRQ